jgi:hypothetical protein
MFSALQYLPGHFQPSETLQNRMLQLPASTPIPSAEQEQAAMRNVHQQAPENYSPQS